MSNRSAEQTDFRASIISLASGESMPVLLRVVDDVEPVSDPEQFAKLTPAESNYNTWRWKRYHQPFEREIMRVVGVYLSADELGEWKRAVSRYDLLKDSLVRGGLLRRLVDAVDAGRVVGARVGVTDQEEMSAVIANAILDKNLKLNRRWVVIPCLFRAVAGLLETSKRGPGTLPANEEKAKANIAKAIENWQRAKGRDDRKNKRRTLLNQVKNWPDWFKEVSPDLYAQLTVKLIRIGN